MKKIILKYSTLILLMVSVVSCDDFLNQNNPNANTTSKFWTNLNDCSAGLTSVYNAFKDENVLSIPAETKRSDLAWPGFGRPTPSTPDEYYYQTFTAGSAAPNSKWAALYTVIFRANQVIESVNKISPTLSKATDITYAQTLLANARFFRGVAYFYLYTSFNNGSVPLIKKVPVEPSDFYNPLAPADSVRSFYLADLEHVYNCSKEVIPYKITDPSKYGQVTNGAAAAILGQSYLYEKNYNKAAEYFGGIINNANYGYALTASIGDNFTTKNEFNSESIFEVSYSIDYKKELSSNDGNNVCNTLNLSFSPIGGFRSIIPSSWLIMAYKNERTEMDPTDTRNTVMDAITNTSRPRDYSLRTSYSIALPDDRDLPYYGQICALSPFSSLEAGYFRKYTNWDICSTEKAFNPIRSGVNVRIIRLADVYLMYAESVIKGGTDEAGVNEALKYINRIRYRSALIQLGAAVGSEYPSSTHDGNVYTAAQIMDHIMYKERPLELSAEGHATRTIDMRRWGITKARFTDLATKKYYVGSMTYPSTDAVTGLPKTVTKFKCVLTETVTGADVLIDFEQAAKNYIPSEHAYWKLPNSEALANPSVVVK